MCQLYVIIRHNRLFDRIHEIEAEQTFLGRDDASGIWLPDRHVSRKHATLIYGENGCRIRDLGSRNGTRVNGRVVSCDEVLDKSAEVEIGPYLLNVCFSIADALIYKEHTDDTTRPDGLHAGKNPCIESKILSLTTAQRRVFDLLLEGFLEKEIARRLGITINTVHGHVKAIYKALSVSSRGELIARWSTHPDRRTSESS